MRKRSDIMLEGYFDAAYADNQDQRSTGCYVFMYYSSPISWSTKVQQVIALYNCGAEYMACTESAREVLWLCHLLSEVAEIEQGPTGIFGVNNGSNAIAKNPEFHLCTKHIEIWERFINAFVELGNIEIIHIPTDKMLANGMTKPLVQNKHNIY